jgi:hypothetical protein
MKDGYIFVFQDTRGRGAQTFVPNINQAVQSDFRTATQSVYRSRTQASYVSLPVNSR